ncbi:glutaminyl-peptide cyclotransferase [uncultured Sunxiuqinia sp.]|uniref:glutaminyl-peptide cyclotransferase n=1 Tax=uncultured Sunxiuqinia sp. TaxID=1573825 RepID=UPI0030DC66D4|tara:strand:- start:2776 stop:3849 length:1074 start_codon:yes stop_codon:yes gene_type:complete
MKFKIFLLLLVASFFVGFISCSNKSQRSRKPVAKITIHPKKNKYEFGDSITISIAVKNKDGELKDSKLYINNELVSSSNNLEFKYSIANLNALGKHSIKVLATKTDGVEGVTFQSYEVVSDVRPEYYGYEVVNTYPHSVEHFTQGLEIHNNNFYESTGEKGKSGIYQFDLKSGNILKSFKMEDQYFGEGITIFNDKIYQLTYKAQKGFVYDLNTFARIDSFTFDTPEGWGLAHDGTHLIKTDGSEFLHFIDPENYQVEKKIQVYDEKGPVKFLNELEFYHGELYANIWTTNNAVKIDPNTGKVLAKINFDGLLSVLYNPDKPIDVLNGIAIHPDNGKMYITGKLWPHLYEVKLIKKE